MLFDVHTPLPAESTRVGSRPRELARGESTVPEAAAAEPRACCDGCAKCVYCRAVDAIEIDCLDDDSGRVCLHTRGLWQFGAPELHLTPPDPVPPGEPGLVVFLTAGLLRAARQLTVAERLAPAAWPAWYRGRPVTFRLGRLEPPSARLTEALSGEVDSVLRLTCSLWE